MYFSEGFKPPTRLCLLLKALCWMVPEAILFGFPWLNGLQELIGATTFFRPKGSPKRWPFRKYDQQDLQSIGSKGIPIDKICLLFFKWVIYCLEMDDFIYHNEIPSMGIPSMIYGPMMGMGC